MTSTQNPNTFPLGRILITKRANAVLDPAVRRQALERHPRGDWGEISIEDAEENDLAISRGLTILSIYEDGPTVFWIITQSDRRITMTLLPSDY